MIKTVPVMNVSPSLVLTPPRCRHPDGCRAASLRREFSFSLSLLSKHFIDAADVPPTERLRSERTPLHPFCFGCRCAGPLTLTMDSLVWAMSEMTPSVMMRSTKYWEPSFTNAAYLRAENTRTTNRCYCFCLLFTTTSQMKSR